MKHLDGRIRVALALAGLALLAAAPLADAKPIGDGRGGVRLKAIGSFEAPVHVATAPGSERLLFVVEQPGRIAVLRERGSSSYEGEGTFLDIRDRVGGGGERGLLSVAFPPDYASSGLFYVYYTDETGDIVVREYRRSSSTRADPSSGREVIRVEHREFGNHNGGQLQFGPDGLLYMATGDGGGGGDPFGAGQDLDSLLGKLLRISPRPGNAGSYGIPADNPFVGAAGRDEIYSYGLRNPWRFSFDSKSGRIAIGDVGQSSREEVDYETRGDAAGANFGWNLFEGTRPFASPDGVKPPAYQGPIHDYSHDDGSCAITGGYVVRDRKLDSVYGRYVYADLCLGELRSLVPRLDGARKDRSLRIVKDGISSFGEGRGGRILVASVFEGRVWLMRPR
jgi:glucose/arabinose dehydrogenase